MPTYTFYNNQTGKQFDALMKISEREEYLKNNPHVTQVITAPSIVSGVSTSSQNRVPDGFKEVLSKVAEKHPESSVGKRYGKRSIKQIKTKQIVEKHLGKI